MFSAFWFIIIIIINSNPLSRKQACKLITQHAAGWRWSGTLAVGGKSLLNLFAQCSLQCLQFPAWEQPLSPAWGCLRFPAWEHFAVPCLGTFAVPAWDACQVPASKRLPGCMPCLGRLPGPFVGALASLKTFANDLPGHIVQSLPGTLCQFPAWERSPMPCLGMFASPCLGTLLARTLYLCSFLKLICASSSLICHAPLQNNESKKHPA